MLVGDVNAIPDFSQLILYTLNTEPPAINPSACSYSAATGSFTCPTGTGGDFTFTISYFLYDGAGHSQSAPDANTTASVRTMIGGSGTLTYSTSSGTLVLADHQDMTLSGLLTPMHTLEGTGTMHVEWTPTPTDTSVMDGKSTASSVVLPASGTSLSNWPMSGLITSDVTATLDTPVRSSTPDEHTVMAFNGTGLVTIVSSHDGKVIRTCTMDLSDQTAMTCRP